MPDMYDKLGDLLNEALESGRIPENTQENKTFNSDNFIDRDTSSENCDKSGLFSFNNSHKTDDKKEKVAVKIPKEPQKATAEVLHQSETVNMHKYTKIMYIPPLVQQALETLDIAYPYDVSTIKIQYRKLLKQYHPDSKTTIQTSDSVFKNRQLTVDDIKNAYSIISDFFKIQ